MSSLIADQVKTNVYFVSVKLFIVLSNFVPLFTIITTITTRLLFLSAYNLFVTAEISNHDCSHTQRVYTQDWLNYFCLSSALSCPFIVLHSLTNVFEVECSCSRCLDGCIVTTLLFVYWVHIVVCAFAYLSILFFSCLLLLVYLERVRCIC